MKIRNSRMFSYPVLSNMYDDYKHSSFTIKTEAQKTRDKLVITITPIIDCQPIIELISNNKAELVVHFECGLTRYRNIGIMHFGANKFEFAGEKLNGNLQIVVFIVAKETINNFNCNLLNDEYGNSTFNIERGSIIGISNQPDVPVPKNIYDLSNINSIVSVIPGDSDDTNMIIEYDDVKIRVKLPEEAFISYSPIGKEVSDRTPILHTMVVIPALIHILDLLAMEDNWVDFEEYLWFKVIKKRCEEKYGVFDQKIIKEKKSVIIAQELINSPIIEAMNNLMEMGV